MRIDTVVVVAIVALSVAYTARRVYRAYIAARQPASGCASDCGCGDHASARKHS